MSQIGINLIKKITKMEEHSYQDDLTKDLKGLIMVRDITDGTNAAHLYSIYSTRYHINQTVTKFEGVKGWLPLIPNLEKAAKDLNANIHVIPVTTEQAQHLHFLSDDMETLYGVLKFTNKKLTEPRNLKRMEA